MDIRDYFLAFRRKWVVVVSCALLAVAVAAMVSFATQPKYTATTRMFVSTTGGASVSEAYQGNLFSTGRVASYAQLAAGKQVAQRAIDQLGLSLTAEEVMSRVTATAVPDSVLLDITVTDANKELARDLANVIASQTGSVVQELETSARGGTPAATAAIVDLADTPDAPSSPDWARNLAFGAVGGLILGLIAAVVAFALDRTLRTSRSLAEYADTTVLGTLPPGRNRKAGAALFSPDSPATTEALREIRTNILAMGSDLPTRTLVVAAPRDNTGASAVAVGLASALAETRRSVVLIDGDFRRGAVKEAFKISFGPGLGEFLRSEADLDTVVVQTDVPYLSVIIRGDASAASSDMLGSLAMGELVKQLQGYFEFVIIDGPSVLTSTDTAVLAGESDGVLLVGRLGYTSNTDIEAAATKLSLARARVIGAVASGRRSRFSSR